MSRLNSMNINSKIAFAVVDHGAVLSYLDTSILARINGGLDVIILGGRLCRLIDKYIKFRLCA